MLHKGGATALTIQTHLDQTFAYIGDCLTFDLALTTYFSFKENFYVQLKGTPASENHVMWSMWPFISKLGNSAYN